MSNQKKLIPIKYDKTANIITVIDQTRLPNDLVEKQLSTSEDVWNAIKKLEVRGAPLIGVTAAYGLAMYAQQIETNSYISFKDKIHENIVYLQSSRPTAVNLENALTIMEDSIENAQSVNEAKVILQNKAIEIHKEDENICESIGIHGDKLLSNNSKVLTICNAGLLATSSSYGTALSPVYKAAEANKNIEVFACETRPVLQGARLTSFELTYNNIPTTVITDNMIGWLFSTHAIDVVFVGCDRVAINGDFANKIGTYTLAVLAKEHGVPFYVCMPSTTIDFQSKNGDEFIIEQRDADEIRNLWFEKPMVAKDAKILNPAFDSTPSRYVTGYITEKGIIKPPFIEETFK